MSNLAKIAENIFIVCEKMSNDFTLPEAERENIVELFKLLPVADYYEINNDVYNFIEDISESEPSGPDFVPSADSKPPSKLCILAQDLKRGASATLTLKTTYGIAENLDGYTVFQYYELPDGHLLLALGGFFTEPWNEEGDYVFVLKDKYDLRDKLYDAGIAEKLTSGAITFACKYFELVNQPRLVKIQPALSRQSRRRMEKKYNIPATSWKRVEWDLSKPRYEPQDGKRGGWNMPLHYTRGHWRRAKEHWDKVVRRKDGECYKWIDGFWSGHPAFGIVRSVHAPKIGDADKAKEMVK